ncbi:long-chain-fatty-acid--CoA ligase [Streptomyces gibsoniae]|uniref:Long-chain fatty acid--CoA ligase n=1 Tax=Streptomyces gibsoniae TaxID=3075529 RepID=A0ABU2U256_9ACTN|nr:long-chain fatty acid--CoA ligase [Streptomyces sp. DSM 41699]MDT0467190.1 long-chain fatty acid--CoA ligase [Streptomyces sp. DSM 41699]
MTNLAHVLVSAADRYGEHSAVQLDHCRLSYRELLTEAGRYANLLSAHGVQPGDRVALALPNTLDFPAAFYGALLSGACIVPMNPLLKEQEARFYLQDSGARLAVADEAADGTRAAAGALGVDVLVPGAGDLAFRSRAATPAERADDDTAVILYTSGTTGRPKGAELTHANLASNAASFAATVAQACAEDVFIGCLPLFHVFGLTCGLLTCAQSGACLTLVPRFDSATVLRVMERDRVSVFAGVPTMYVALLQERRRTDIDLSSLRLCLSGGAAMPVELMRSFEREFACAVLEGYGQSESSGVTAFNHPGRPRKPGTIGTPIEGMHMCLLDDHGNEVPPGAVGEIAIRGEGVMKGYWRQPEATAKAMPDGWLRTGDLATHDADGYYSIVDRKKSVIIRGGYNVYPREIEEVLYHHPAVLEAVVVGIPDPRLGEEIGAAVVVRPGAEVDTETLRQWVKERVAPYKYPRHVWFVDRLPKGASGKLLRRQVKAPTFPTAGPTVPDLSSLDAPNGPGPVVSL